MEVAIDGTSVAYESVGGGETILLIHGFPLNRRMWNIQSKALSASGYRVITFDLPGFGSSPPFPGEASISRYADCAVTLLERLQVERAIIGGMSMGGYILLDILERYPQKASAALFLMTRPGNDDEAARERRTRLAAEVMAGNLQAVADAFIPLLFAEETLKIGPHMVEEVRTWILAADPRGVAAALLAMRDRRDYTPLLPSFTLPALVITGEADRAVAAEQAAPLRSMIRGAEGCVVPGAGHLANMEKPEEFDRCLLEFLDEMQSRIRVVGKVH